MNSWFVRAGISFSLLVSAGRFVAAETAQVEFVDVAGQAGIDFVHINGASGRKYFPETMGGGVAFVDYDGDEYVDAYMVNGAPFPRRRAPWPDR